MLHTTSQEPVACEDCDAELNEIDPTGSCTEMLKSNQIQDSQPPKKSPRKMLLLHCLRTCPHLQKIQDSQVKVTR